MRTLHVGAALMISFGFCGAAHSFPLIPSILLALPGKVPPSWSHPGEHEYVSAIDEGYDIGRRYGDSDSALTHIPIATVKLQLGKPLSGEIELEPPLYCAEMTAAIAAAKLKAKPGWEETQSRCSLEMTLRLRHWAKTRDSEWHVAWEAQGVLSGAGLELRDKAPRSLPTGGYRFDDVFTLPVESGFHGDFRVIVADELGRRFVARLDTVTFENDFLKRTK